MANIELKPSKLVQGGGREEIGCGGGWREVDSTEIFSVPKA